MYVLLTVSALSLVYSSFFKSYIYNKNEMEVVLTKSIKPDKKYDARINDTKTVSFGQKGASDFTKHKNSDRKERYIDRHKNNEDWTKSGAKTAGFYNKHDLWNKPTLKASIDYINKRFKKLNVKMKQTYNLTYIYIYIERERESDG